MRTTFYKFHRRSFLSRSYWPRAKILLNTLICIVLFAYRFLLGAGLLSRALLVVACSWLHEARLSWLVNDFSKLAMFCWMSTSSLSSSIPSSGDQPSKLSSVPGTVYRTSSEIVACNTRNNCFSTRNNPRKFVNRAENEVEIVSQIWISKTWMCQEKDFNSNAKIHFKKSYSWKNFIVE